MSWRRNQDAKYTSHGSHADDNRKPWVNQSKKWKARMLDAMTALYGKKEPEDAKQEQEQVDQ